MNGATTSSSRWLFWTCFIALIATSFGFIIRVMILGEWGRQFGISPTQQGELFGVGLWPFAISIVVFSLVIDRIGYDKAMAFALVCHVASAIVTIVLPRYRDPYWSLYWGTFIVALGNGTVEAVINPVVAAMFPREKTKWLNILHAGWPGGLVIGGLITLSMNPGGILGKLAGATDAVPIAWEWKVALLLIPTAIYGLMMLRCSWPVSERVAAGVPYRDMLREAGVIGMLIVAGMVVWELSRVFLGGWFAANDWSTLHVNAFNLGVTAVVLAPLVWAIGLAPGRWLFILLLLLMIPLATTELGTDAWIKELMAPQMAKLGQSLGIGVLDGGWVLVYSASIMVVLRFFAGPIVKLLSPLGLLAAGSAFAVIGLASMSKASGLAILAAATVYGIGQTFFWPTTLGVVAERFPRGGALTLNGIAGVGMLGVGIIGTALLGNIQDKQIDRDLAVAAPEIHAKVVEPPRISVFGFYRPVNPKAVAALPADEQAVMDQVAADAKQSALFRVAAMPLFMCACYVALILYFRARGGYTAEVLAGHAADDGRAFTGGVAGPVD